jgi:hypothetical protein
MAWTVKTSPYTSHTLNSGNLKKLPMAYNKDAHA